jgi:hypothetical protein
MKIKNAGRQEEAILKSSKVDAFYLVLIKRHSCAMSWQI